MNFFGGNVSVNEVSVEEKNVEEEQRIDGRSSFTVDNGRIARAVRLHHLIPMLIVVRSGQPTFDRR